ncbi:MAG: TonB-dependent receptor [Gemmatimonadaceae bacterium]|nr:TonB-dependent receptor [Gemmatimonadaceae bacterium]
MNRHAIAAIAAFAFAVGTADAQQTTRPPSDSTRSDSAARSRSLEGVIIRAVRASGTAPIAQTTVDASAIDRRSFAQDVPMMLLGTTPSLTAHSESGTNWGYSYLRLRGIDQSRINLSIDGIPLNDPEDQVFYFANFADLASSMQSVQVQRGVGTTGTGTAAFAGSINFETKPVLGAKRMLASEIQGGSFGAQRVMLEGNSGMLRGGFASSIRLSALRTNSYRRNAGVEGLSGLAQVAWLGSRDIIKLMVLGGRLRDTLSYLAVPLPDLERDRRINPLTPEEQDRFSQALMAVSHTRQFAPGVQYASTVYRISAEGNYDVRFDTATVANFSLDFAWYGLTSALNVERNGLRLSAGLNANTYGRDHYAYFSNARATPDYFNTGQKRDASVFTKGALTRGPVTWFADLQVRRALFRYQPDSAAGFAGSEPSVAWTFFNPKLGVTWSARPNAQLFASVGRTTREPTRNDMLSGNDDVSSSVLADLGGLRGVNPERVTDTEFGVRFRQNDVQVEVNLFRMDFRNEIARIGALSPLGAELRSNVAASVRQGIEFDFRARAGRSVTLATIGSVSHNRIREFVDNTGPTAGVVRRNVPPLLAPAVTGTQRIDWRVARWLDIGGEARFQGESFLRNDGDRALVLPPYWILDAMLRVPLGSNDITVRGTNLANSQRFGSGYAVDGVPNFFILTPRSVFVTVRLATR